MLTEAIRLIITLAAAVSAAYLAKNATIAFVRKDIALILIIIIGTGLGYVFGGIIGRRITHLVEWINEKTQNISSQQLLSGIAGLVIGLVVAALIVKPLESLLKPINIASPYIITLVYIILGYTGFILFVNRRLDFPIIPSEDGQYLLTPNVLDTSIAIDGRIADILKAGFIQGRIIIPYFVLGELQTLADSADDLRRAKGRRGLEVLQQLQDEKDLNVQVLDNDFPALTEVDDKLIKLCKELKANLITNDYNLSKIAILEGVHVFNLNDLANSLKTIVLPGESFKIAVIKDGKEKDQGVGYLDDGTMIVVQNGKKYIGETIEVTVSSIVQTSAGKLIFTSAK